MSMAAAPGRGEATWDRQRPLGTVPTAGAVRLVCVSAGDCQAVLGNVGLDSRRMAASVAWMAGRRWVARGFFLVAVVTQLGFIVRGYSDPHKHFAFQPFNDWDLWRADIVRVTYRGLRVPVEQPWAGYTWAGLIGGDRGLWRPKQLQPASSGMRSLLVFLQQALDYAAYNTPRDRETYYYEARVVYTHNGGPEERVLLKSRPHVLEAVEAVEAVEAAVAP